MDLYDDSVPRRSQSPAGQSLTSAVSSFHELVSPVEEHDEFMSGGIIGSPDRKEQQYIPYRPPPSSDQEEKNITAPNSSTILRRSSNVLLLVLGYATLALFAWIITCILNCRPLTTDHYGVYITNNNLDGYPFFASGTAHRFYLKNEQCLQAARVIQSIVSVLTIPLTSAVCSRAAVIFMQRNCKSQGITLRQIMVLADKGWTQPENYCNLLFKGWKRYASSFLVLAIVINALGKSSISESHTTTDVDF